MFLKPNIHKFHFFVLGHKSESDFKSPFLQYVNLNDLDVGKYQRNEYSESRIFHANLSQYSHDYFGFGTWKWNQKYSWVPPLDKLNQLIPRFRPDLVLTPSPVYMDLSNSEVVKAYYFPMPQGWDIFQEVANHMGLPLDPGNHLRVFCNSFICHQRVYNEFVEVFRREMDWLIQKYGDCENLQFLHPADLNRKPGYLFEMITVHYFANRKDLQIEEIARFR